MYSSLVEKYGDEVLSSVCSYYIAQIEVFCIVFAVVFVVCAACYIFCGVSWKKYRKSLNFTFFWQRQGSYTTKPEITGRGLAVLVIAMIFGVGSLVLEIIAINELLKWLLYPEVALISLACEGVL